MDVKKRLVRQTLGLSVSHFVVRVLGFVLRILLSRELGAAAMGDIGRHFPDSDDAYKGISSMKLLKIVVEKLSGAGWQASNVDVTIIAQKPKLAARIPQMQKNIAQILGLPEDCVNVKATTTERMGFEGAGEGISAHAVAMLTNQR